jgi:hypothetical protein
VIKVEYKRRLFEKVPKYKMIPFEALVPDMFLMALRKREGELQSENTKRAGSQ